MGLNIWLVDKIGADKAGKLKAILGGLFVYVIAGFPISTMVEGLDWNPVYKGYINMVWAATVIAITAIIILFFGKSDIFPYPATNTLAESEEKTEQPAEAVEEVVSTDNANIDEPPTKPIAE